MTTDRLLRDAGATLEVTAYVDGTGTDADGAVTVTVKKADGTTLSTGAATAPGAGVYRYTLAPQANLNFLTVTWAGVWSGVANTLTSYAELVGRHLFSEAEFRAFSPALASATNYPDAAIANARAQVTDLIESHTGVSWVPRFRRHTLYRGPSGVRLQLPNAEVTSILSASVDDTAFDATELADIELDGRHAVSGGTYWHLGTVVEYEHGYAHDRDGVGRIAMLWAKKLLVPTGIADSATSYTNELGTTSYAPFAPSGVREVDAWLAAHRAILGSS